jgi:serine phosphatase RsbU (regulator of sigma subunit)/FixJ family two-component response regulator
MHKKPIILCVDDEKIVLDSLLEQLENHFSNIFSFEMAESAKEGLEIIEDCIAQNQDIAILISDQLMPGIKGDEFIIRSHKIIPDALKILLTGEANVEAISNVINHAQLYRYIPKPWEKTDFLLTIEEASKSYLQKAELKEYNKLLKNLNIASQELSKEVNLNGLLKKFLSLVVENSYAQKGVVFTKKQDKLWYRADCLKKDKIVNLYDFTEDHIITDDTKAPFSIIETCYTQIQTLLYTGNNEVFDTNPYIQKNKVKSFVAIPLIKHGKVLSVLYLEHTQNKSNFTPKILEALDVLVSQVTISLDNVQLYNNLEKRVKERTKEVVAQKEIIESQNKDILDSIRYARRIQENILPNHEQVQKIFTEYCIIYEPKDILSGDFYWFSMRYHHAFMAVADCTGHGVPGAFMSVIGHTLLNQIVNQEDIYEPAHILDALHKKLGKFLSYSEGYSENAIRDGMDVALVRYDILDKKIHFAGANRPMIFISKQGELHEIKGSSHAIGGEINVEKPHYKQHTLNIQTGDRFYIFSDGYTDQFDSEDKKRYSSRQFRELLLKHNSVPMYKMKEVLGHEWLRWRGSNQQTDDILVVGIQVP